MKRKAAETPKPVGKKPRKRGQDIDNAKSFLERNGITTFDQLEKYKTEKGREFDRQEQIFIPRWRRLEQLKALAKAYSDYEPYKAVYDMSKSLNGLKKMRYDKEHEHELVMYENTRADLKMLLSEGERITPKAWRTERERLEKEKPTLRNEGRRQNKMQSRGKRRRKNCRKRLKCDVGNGTLVKWRKP